MAELDPLAEKRKQFFETRRQEAQRQSTAALQEGENALQRRFATLNMQGSGAAISANLKNREIAEEGRRRALADVGAQELQADLQSGEAERGRQFASLEAEKGRSFGAGESERARQFQKGMSDVELGFRRELAAEDKASKLKQFDLAERQFQLAKESEEFNRRLAELAMGKTPEDGGILGTGVTGDDVKKAQVSTLIGGVPAAILDRVGIRF